mmetsp:Transcript_1172/g.1764  ORF Transcript_1172/g.1764 Transcript_1172/m.1764 type:complete len:128 (-) Transcript_1172:821-1204(-)
MALQPAQQAIEDLVATTVTMPNPQTKIVSGNLGFLNRIKDLFFRLFNYVTTGKNWKSNPKLWIGSLIFLRLLLVFLREYGLTLNKKNLSKEHIFLTGAGSGLGRLMARKFGAMGAKLSISDINLPGV